MGACAEGFMEALNLLSYLAAETVSCYQLLQMKVNKVRYDAPEHIHKGSEHENRRTSQEVKCLHVSFQSGVSLQLSVTPALTL